MCELLWFNGNAFWFSSTSMNLNLVCEKTRGHSWGQLWKWGLSVIGDLGLFINDQNIIVYFMPLEVGSKRLFCFDFLSCILILIQLFYFLEWLMVKKILWSSLFMRLFYSVGDGMIFMDYFWCLWIASYSKIPPSAVVPVWRWDASYYILPLDEDSRNF